MRLTSTSFCPSLLVGVCALGWLLAVQPELRQLLLPMGDISFALWTAALAGIAGAQFSDNESFRRWLSDTIFGVTYESDAPSAA